MLTECLERTEALPADGCIAVHDGSSKGMSDKCKCTLSEDPELQARILKTLRAIPEALSFKADST